MDREVKNGKVIVHPETNHYIGPITFQHDAIPTYEQCRQMIRELAYSRWERAGRPEGRDAEFWLLAEKILFSEQENYLLFGGYRIYVMDKTKPLQQDFYYHYDVVIVTPSGPHFFTKEDTKLCLPISRTSGKS